MTTATTTATTTHSKLQLQVDPGYIVGTGMGVAMATPRSQQHLVAVNNADAMDGCEIVAMLVSGEGGGCGHFAEGETAARIEEESGVVEVEAEGDAKTGAKWGSAVPDGGAEGRRAEAVMDVDRRMAEETMEEDTDA